jgi:hypothetical protein
MTAEVIKELGTELAKRMPVVLKLGNSWRLPIYPRVRNPYFRYSNTLRLFQETTPRRTNLL